MTAPSAWAGDFAGWNFGLAEGGGGCDRHLHRRLRRGARLSLRTDDDSPVFADDRALFERFLAGQLATLRELTLFLAPNINSYKRFQEGSFAPTAVAWGRDNRTCAYRVIGHGPSLRIECRLPGGNVNPLRGFERL